MILLMVERKVVNAKEAFLQSYASNKEVHEALADLKEATRLINKNGDGRFVTYKLLTVSEIAYPLTVQELNDAGVICLETHLLAAQATEELDAP